jgi:uncharacterized protein
MNYAAIVQQIYAAFGRGDIPAILAHLHADVAWESWSVDHSAQKAGLPYMLPRHGAAEVPRFFEALVPMKFHVFEVLSLLAGGNQVAAEIRLNVELPNGAHVHDEELHLWTFDEHGKVTRFRHYLDTRKHLRAAGL